MKTLRLVLCVFLLSLLSGAVSACSSPTNLHHTPEFRVALQQVDDAIVEENYDEAKKALKELSQLTVEARKAGTLSDTQARDILEAAAQLSQDIGTTTSSEVTEDPASSETEPIDSPDPPDEKSTAKHKDKRDKGDKSKDKRQSERPWQQPKVLQGDEDRNTPATGWSYLLRRLQLGGESSALKRLDREGTELQVGDVIAAG